ncbi:MAG: hypothetical protein PHW62_06005 [Candidatus Ratteibacteria bacterium]|nr:hypothetical protein [Candidatus Ratteibacteria bacterium]
MEFRVKFVPNKDRTNVLYFDRNKTPAGHLSGLTWLDDARKVTGVSNLNHILVYTRPYGKNSIGKPGSDWRGESNLECTLDELEARDSNLFSDKYDIIVTIPSLFLNNFLKREVYVEKSDENGEIKIVSQMYSLDIEALTNAWRDAGFPTQWTIE